MPSKPRPPRQHQSRLADRLLLRIGSMTLTEMHDGGVFTDICSAVVALLFQSTGRCALLAYSALVLHRPGADPVDCELARFGHRLASDCIAQATVCVHPIGCRDVHTTIDPGDGLPVPMRAGDVFLTSYDMTSDGGDAPHVVGWEATSDAHMCACLSLLLVEA